MAGGGGATASNAFIDTEMRKAGAFGRFQCFVFLVVVFGMQSGAFFLKGFSILEKAPTAEPEYLCTDNGSSAVEYPCKPSDFCGSTDITYRVNTALSGNDENFYTQFSFMCEKKIWLSLIPMSFLTGMVIGSLFLPRLTDLRGRKTVYAYAVIVQTVMLYTFCFLRQKLAAVLLVFVWGIATTGRVTGGFFLLIEHQPKRLQPIFGGAVMVLEGVSIIIWDLYLQFVSPAIFWFLIGCSTMSLISAVLIWLVPESPLYLYGTG